MKRRIFIKGFLTKLLFFRASSAAFSKPIDKMSGMPTRVLGKTGLKVPIFSLGGEGVLRTVGKDRDASFVIQQALTLGVRYFDSSPVYKNCQHYLGQNLLERRKEIYLASKTHHRDRDGSLRLLDQNLKNMRTDYLDIWQLHDLRTEDDLKQIFSPNGAIKALEEAKREGRVRFIGLTGHHSPAVLLKAIKEYSFDTLLIPLNVADRSYNSFIDQVLPEARRQNMGIIGMKVYGGLSSLGRSVLGRSGAGLKHYDAFNYVVSLPVSTVIIGCSTPQEVENNFKFSLEFKQLSHDQMAKLEKTAEIVSSSLNRYKG